jgi:hypothetical protein
MDILKAITIVEKVTIRIKVKIWEGEQYELKGSHIVWRAEEGGLPFGYLISIYHCRSCFFWMIMFLGYLIN